MTGSSRRCRGTNAKKAALYHVFFWNGTPSLKRDIYDFNEELDVDVI